VQEVPRTILKSFHRQGQEKKEKEKEKELRLKPLTGTH
jgi:hypothetical protein